MKSFLTVAVGLVFTASALAAARPAPIRTTGETVILPDFTVKGRKELPPPESWRYGKLEDGTEVLSNASERETRRVLRDFQMFQQALALAWPAVGEWKSPVARTLILCGRRDKYDDFAAAMTGDGDLGATSHFVRNREQAAIIVDLQATSIALGGLDDDASGRTLNFEVDPNKQLYREYVRFLLSQSGRRPPPWLQEGISQIVMAMQFGADWVTLGEIDESTADTGQAFNPTVASPGSGGGRENMDQAYSDVALPTATVGDRPFNVVLRRRALIPMEDFFAVPAEAPEANNPHGNNRWAKQAYAFVHMCLYGENGRYKTSFEEFTKRLATQPQSEALFQECFKMSYRDMMFTLRGYIDFTAHRTDIFKLKPGSPRFGGEPVALRDATQSEIGRIKGDAQRLGGRVNDALTSYSDAYARGEREPILLASYGIAASETNQSERALPLLEAAAKGPGTRRPTTYIELARQRLIAARAQSGGNPIGEPQVVAVMEPLLKARSIGLPLPGIYSVMADAWLAAAKPPAVKDFNILGEGLRFFPRDTTILLPLAQLYRRIGENNAAAQVAQAGLRVATSAADRARFEDLLASATPAGVTK